MRVTGLLLLMVLSAAPALAQDRLLWEQRVDMNGGTDIARAVAVSGRTVVVAGNATVPTGLNLLSLAYRKRTGRPVWTNQGLLAAGYNLPVFAATSPGMVFTAGYRASSVLDVDIVVSGYDAATGQPLWEGVSDKGGDDFPTDFAANARAVVVVGYGGATQSHPSVDAVVRAYRPLTGEMLWEDQLDVVGTDDQALSVAITNTDVFVLGRTLTQNGTDLYLRAYDLETGLLQWDVRMPTVSAGVVRAHGGRVFISGSAPGASFTAAFRARTGQLLWQEDSVEQRPHGLQVRDGRVIELGAGVRARDVKTGQTLWETAFPEEPGDDFRFLSAMDVGAHGIYVTGVAGKAFEYSEMVVYAYGTDGTLLWTDRFARSPMSGASDIIVKGKRLFVVGYVTSPENRLDSDFLIRAYDVSE